MSPRRSKLKGAILARARIKEEIKKQFGATAIGDAMLRLCKVCEHRGTCLLYPITTRGEDCPYFKEVKDATNNSNTS